MLNKSILEVEKGCGKKFNEMIDNNYQKLWQCGGQKDMFDEKKEYCPTCQAKLSTLKECQAKFDKLKELLKQKKCHGRNFIGETEECFEREWNECIDELSSKEGKE
jgi:hypothetical protein